jgi:hypothetical protein
MSAFGCRSNAAALVIAVRAETLGVNFALHTALSADFCFEDLELGLRLQLLRSSIFQVLMYLLIGLLVVCLVLLIEVLTRDTLVGQGL